MMLKGGDKQIINLSSIGANLIQPGFSSYETGKLAIVRFSEFINAENGNHGIMAYSMHPGAINMDMG